MAFPLFLLLNAALFVRPAEIFPDLQWNFYLYLTIAAVPVASGQMLKQLTWDALKQRPITLCVVGMWVMICLSNLVQFNLSDTWTNTFEFGKVVVYYLLLVGVLDSGKRIKQFLVWLSLLITIVAALAVLQYYEVIHLASHGSVGELGSVGERYMNAETGELEIIQRMRGTGIFNDPNDLSLILNMGIVLILFKLGDRESGSLRFIWIGPLVVLLYALKLTYSRSGLLTLGCALMMLLSSRYGWKKGLLAAIMGLAILIPLFGGRQTNFDFGNKEDTGQGRIHFWAEGLALLRSTPIFGIGAARYADEVGDVAHNSFVHSFTELGFIGGSFFVGAFYFSIRSLWRLRSLDSQISDPEMSRLLPYLTTIPCTYAFGILTLSRSYVIPTYIPIGLTVAYLSQVEPVAQSVGFQVNKWSAKELGLAGMTALTLLYACTRFLGNYQ